ncbi:response regulator [Halobacillus mangrovi]|uniref:Two-component system response regulator DcuR n=1 Tax=Halobacillus mangrovi TaxID=402384 RepID=A0A1W5ZU31_9BACI|nr:response regulator [Halobacillus mangrovi]ARI76785.1 two-component system response regulator DcuR [Halobacillus mangrovi]
MIKTLVVEDDPMVAELNKQYLEKIEGFQLTNAVSSAEDAIEFLEQNRVDLLLLDVYMPGINGIDLLRQIRQQNKDIDVILITAASQIDQIQNSLRLGIIDYLIKPFEYERFCEALNQYKNSRSTFLQKDKISQQELDILLQRTKEPPISHKSTKVLPKGLTRNTLKTIQQSILSYAPAHFSTSEIAESTNVSRVSVRKYLKFLKEINYLEEHLVYGVGRPIYQYRLNEHNQSVLSPYL